MTLEVALRSSFTNTYLHAYTHIYIHTFIRESHAIDLGGGLAKLLHEKRNAGVEGSQSVAAQVEAVLYVCMYVCMYVYVLYRCMEGSQSEVEAILYV